MKKIIKFSTKTCSPCISLKPIFDKVSIENNDVLFESIDCHENPEITQKYGIRGVPCLVLLDEQGNEIKRNVGFINEEQLNKFMAS